MNIMFYYRETVDDDIPDLEVEVIVEAEVPVKVHQGREEIRGQMNIPETLQT
jgi:hypothetical protein